MGGVEEKLHEEIADFSLWLFTTVLKLKGKFGESEGRSETAQESLIRIGNSCSDLRWHKYPNLCHSCSGRKIAGDTTIPASLGLNPCECLSRRPETEKKEERRKRLSGVHNYSDRVRGEKPISIDGWQQMFSAIFASNLTSLSLTQMALHVMEELGEASDAIIRMYTYKEETFRSGEPNWRQLNLEGQLADVFSRTFALAEKLNLLTNQSSDAKRAESVRLSGIIWKRYGSESLTPFFCPFCKHPVCRCPLIFVPATRPIDELLQKF